MAQPRPARPERVEPSGRKSSLVPVLLVLAPLTVLVLGVIAFTGQAGLMMLGAIACIPAFVFLHYLLWGRWLMKSLRARPPEDRTAADRTAADRAAERE